MSPRTVVAVVVSSPLSPRQHDTHPHLTSADIRRHDNGDTVRGDDKDDTT